MNLNNKTMENRQTVVNWIIQQINNKVIGDGDYRTLSDILEQAKSMEKEQIKEAYKSGCVDEMWELNNTENEEHYYNKTYNKKDDA